MAYKTRKNSRRTKRKRRQANAYTRTNAYKPRMTNLAMKGLTTMSRYPLGQSYSTTLTYFERDITITPLPSGATSVYNYSVNGIFDPNITGTGHQPLGFDNLMAMYFHYVVTGAHIYINCTNTDVSNAQFLGVRLSGTASGGINVQTIIEQGLTTVAYLNAAGSDAAASGAIDLGCSVAKFLNRKDIVDDQDLRGDAASNPLEQIYFQIYAAPDVSVQSDLIRCNVRIEYHVTFLEPKSLISS